MKTFLQRPALFPRTALTVVGGRGRRETGTESKQKANNNERSNRSGPIAFVYARDCNQGLKRPRLRREARKKRMFRFGERGEKVTSLKARMLLAYYSLGIGQQSSNPLVS